MMRRRPGDGRRPAPNSRLLLAFAIILLPWLQLADAQQQQQQQSNPQSKLSVQSGSPHANQDGQNDQISADAAVRWAATSIDAVTAQAARDTTAVPRKRSRSRTHEKRQLWHQPEKSNNILNTEDESAIATLAPEKSVRAPVPSRSHRSRSLPATGLTSQQIARSLEDWEVEDFVLLATVDGHLYASDRKTGKERWHLEVDQPMVDTKHYPINNSVLDDEYSPIDHYVWAVEPNSDGGLYIWRPDTDSGLLKTGFTMKQLVEELSPHTDHENGVVYTGDKKTTMVTLDATTGRVLKWFGSTGSHVNEQNSCFQPNAFSEKDEEECRSTGTITLGRTEYTVTVHKEGNGQAIATLKYSEWGPNTFDSDLYHQYHASLDSRYITSQHDGKVYGFDQSRADERGLLFSQKFTAPVARVFDVCRPWDAVSESNPQLIVLPQPAMPSPDKQARQMRSNNIFLNQTESGSWYAMSGNAYPLIIDAPVAQAASSEWLSIAPLLESVNQARIDKALVGRHFLESAWSGNKQIPSLPAGETPEAIDDPADHMGQRRLDEPIPQETCPPDIIQKVKSLPQSAANSVVDFVSNPILIILFFTALVYNQKKLRRSYHKLRLRGFQKGIVDEVYNYIYPEEVDDKDDNEAEDGQDNKDQARKTPPLRHESSDAGSSEPELSREDSPARETSLEDGGTTPTSKPQEQIKEQVSNSDGANTPPRDADDTPDTPVPEKKKKKAHRGTRGGKNRKKQPRDTSQTRPNAQTTDSIDQVVKSTMEHPGPDQALQPNVVTVGNNDMQAVTGPIIRMGNIEVNTEIQLGTGSNGTLVFAGWFDGREVAVKRMLIQFYDIASQETRLLRESDDHPNVIRYYSQQMQDGFLYIALERCAASLADVVEKPHVYRDLANAGRMDLPSVLYQISNGISHLHNLRIVHRDLKPQNILINMDKDGRPRLLVSDFGLCKKLEGGQSSFGATTGRAAGTSGWRAPELLLDDDAREISMVDASTHSGSGSILANDSLLPGGRRATRAIDIFSLGLVFFYVLTNGSHPFDCGDRYMREVNIRKGSYNLRNLDSLGDYAYEAKDLVASMLDADPKRRPQAREVMSHPFFWSAKKRLTFLCDVSDHFEKEPRDPPSPALQELERHAAEVTKGDFQKILPREFIDSLGKQRKYTGSRLLDLLRALRNKRNHYEDMTESLQRTVGPLPEGYLSFWTTRFPMLLLVCWNVVYNVRWEETDRFRDYYEPAGL